MPSSMLPHPPPRRCPFLFHVNGETDEAMQGVGLGGVATGVQVHVTGQPAAGTCAHLPSPRSCPSVPVLSVPVQAKPPNFTNSKIATETEFSLFSRK